MWTVSTGNDTMFPPSPVDMESTIKQCESAYGVPPRPHWVTTYFGGHVYMSSSPYFLSLNFLNLIYDSSNNI